ncbi:MAG TPA: diphosphomevalonate decarboxylase, partial [Polyangiaceae bacterium]|nr:diphosphomevalonate decarboxylase [Polyangiaceae bacterium]
MTAPLSALAIAHSNIALAKYWGKADVQQNLPAVPSLSLTLDNLRTATRVTFDPALKADQAWLDGTRAEGRVLERVTTLLERVRKAGDRQIFARVESINDFPTAAGLASSASGFAALALASTRALGLDFSSGQVSSLARASSASAARSVFGGYAMLGCGVQEAEPVASGNHLPIVMLVAVTASGPKAVSSTEGMTHTATTSPYYAAWLDHAPRVFEDVKRAVLARDFDAMGRAAEHSALMMHASMIAANPAILYFSPASVAVIRRVRELRDQGLPAFITMDAGPHVKVLTRPEIAQHVQAAITEV